MLSNKLVINTIVPGFSYKNHKEETITQISKVKF